MEVEYGRRFFLSLILIQVRDLDDAMIKHEEACISRRLGGAPFRVHNAIGETLKPKMLDGATGVIIGGSGEYGVNDIASQDWMPGLRGILEEVLSRGIPGFGVCFGHQLLGLHLGGTVETSPGHAEIGTAEFFLTEEGKRDPVFGMLPPRFTGQTGHSDSVTTTPTGVTRLASTDKLANQAFRVDSVPFYSAQFHPDLLGEEARYRYLAYEATMTSRAERGVGEADLFIPGEDDAAILLGAFLEHVCVPV